jgi:hypothetical protein
MSGSMIEQLLAASGNAGNPASSQPESNAPNTTTDSPYNLFPYDPIKAHNDGIAFYDRFCDDHYQGMTRVFFSGCIAYNRTADAITASTPRISLEEQETILRAALAEWKRRFLAGPVDNFGRKHWEKGLELIETLSRGIHVVHGCDLLHVPRPGWDENLSACFANLVLGRPPGEAFGLSRDSNFRIVIADPNNPESVKEAMEAAHKRNNDRAGAK